MFDYLIQLDTDALLWINSKNAIFWDLVMRMASSKLIWVGMYLAILFAIYRAYGWRTLIVMCLASALAVTLADQITSTVLRPIFQRYRPARPDSPISHLVHIVGNYRGGGVYGFPSSHASNTFAVAFLMSLLFKRPRFSIFIFFWALLNCYSRAYLGVHYPGDLLAGMVIGTLVGLFVYWLVTIALKKWKGCEGPGRTDKIRRANIGGVRFRYREVDVVILAGFITVLYMIFSALAIVV